MRRIGLCISLMIAGVLLAMPMQGSAQVEPAFNRGWSPQAPPADLEALKSMVAESVVSVTCGERKSTAWSQGWEYGSESGAYLIGSSQALDGCRDGGVQVLVGGAQVTGRAGSSRTGHVDVTVPGFVQPLQWRSVPTPVVGQWVAAIGAGPQGVVSFSVGQVLDVGTDRITTSAILNEGNVGGPLVDSAGRVIAMNVSSMDGTYVAQNERGQVSDWTLAAAPSVPRNFRIVKQVGRELTVAWDRPADPGADVISDIQVGAYPGSSGCSVAGRQVRLQTQCTLRSMVIGIPYTLYVYAGNQFGISARVNLPMEFTPVTTAPGAPEVVTAAYDGAARTVKVRWKKPNDGASPLTGYTAGLVPGGPQCSVPPGPPAQLTCTLQDVSLATGMQAQVRAENQIGPGEWGTLPVAWRRVASCAAFTERDSTRVTCQVERDRDTGGNSDRLYWRYLKGDRWSKWIGYESVRWSSATSGTAVANVGACTRAAPCSAFEVQVRGWGGQRGVVSAVYALKP